MSASQSAHMAPYELRNLLQFANPDKNHQFTCVGYAPTKGRRCRTHIALSNQAAAVIILDALDLRPESRNALLNDCKQLAGLALCRRYHQSQVNQVARLWYHTLSREHDRRATTTRLDDLTTLLSDVAISTPTPPTAAPISPITGPQHPAVTSSAPVVSTDSSLPTPARGPSVTVLSPPRASNSLALDRTHLPLQTVSEESLPTRAPQRSETISPPPPAMIEAVIPVPHCSIARPTAVDELPRNSTEATASENPGNNAESADDADNQCDICYRTYEDPCRTPCGHVFCRGCISPWVRGHNTCPYDRRPLHIEQLVPLGTTECGICLETVEDPHITPCGHTFCGNCISEWVRHGEICPYDRSRLRLEDLVAVTDRHNQQDSESSESGESGS